jgi:hypothetical protein
MLRHEHTPFDLIDAPTSADPTNPKIMVFVWMGRIRPKVIQARAKLIRLGVATGRCLTRLEKRESDSFRICGR